uniref:Putative odorant-binding protein 3 n=1 Tax=Telenomus podisi TaxID=408256 RepID=A0A097QH89_9HYME|nr:putative odorant-binding protein 3 [Telenomus podisi]
MKNSTRLSVWLIIGLQIAAIYCKLSIKDLSEMTKRLGQAKCLKESGAKLEQVVAARSGTFANDNKLKCYYKCILEQMKMMKDGRFQVEHTERQIKNVMKDSLHEPLIRSGLKCYNKRTKSEPCELSFEAVKCWYNSNPSYFFF